MRLATLKTDYVLTRMEGSTNMKRRSLFRMAFNRSMTSMEKYLLGIIVAYIVVVTVKNPEFFSFETMFDMIRNGSGIMILALGVLVVLISGGIDVSFTAIAIVSGYSSVKLMKALNLDNLFFVIGVAVVIGVLLGLINALLIHFFQLPTLIVTLGTASVFHGLMTIFLGTKTFTEIDVPKSMLEFGASSIFAVETERSKVSLSIFLVIVVACTVLTWFLLYRTTIGRAVFAMGSSEESASRIGISILRTKIFVYCYSGFLSGLMGIIYFSGLKYINPVTLIGTELMIIAAVVIGGAKLTGGEGTILGAVLGIILVQLFQSTLVFLGLDASWNNLFFGTVLLLSLSFMYYRQRQINKRALVFSSN